MKASGIMCLDIEQPAAARHALQPDTQQLMLPHINAVMRKQAAHWASTPAGV